MTKEVKKEDLDKLRNEIHLKSITYKMRIKKKKIDKKKELVK